MVLGTVIKTVALISAIATGTGFLTPVKYHDHHTLSHQRKTLSQRTWLRIEQGNHQKQLESNTLLRTTARHDILEAESKVLLCTDFDNTIIFKDTTSPLISLALESHQQNKTMMKIWNKTLKTYVDNTNAVVSRYITESNSNEFNKEGLNSFLQAYHAVDSAAIDEMTEMNLLSGISLKALSKIALELQNFVDPAFNTNDNFVHHIVSLNWCERLVKLILEKSPQSPSKSRRLKFYGNSIEFLNDKSTGVMTRVLETPWDKRNLLRRLVSKQANHVTSVFVGDSVSDLLALLEADIGFIIKPKEDENKATMLIEKAAKAFNIKLLPVSRLSKTHSTRNNTLYVVQSWSQIYNIIKKF